MTGCRIRDARTDDAPAMATLLGQLGYPSTDTELSGRLARLSASPLDRILVADDPGAGVVGLLVLHVAALLHHAHDIAIIMALVVDESRRGGGVGAALVDAAATIARDRGCDRLMVTTNVRRADAHRFYERLQFELTGRRYVLTLT